MPYTRPWSTTSPTDATLAVNIDDEFRNLKVDIQERMNSIPGVVWTNDPVYSNSILYIIVPWNSGNGYGTGSGWTTPTSLIQYVQPTAISTTVYWALNIPLHPQTGNKPTSITFYVHRDAGIATINVYVQEIDMTSGTPVVCTGGSGSFISTGYGTVVLTPTYAGYDPVCLRAQVNLTADAANANSARFYAIKATY